ESPSQIQSINAPNVVGDEDGSFTYGTGWGYYKTGHGLPASQKYPASGGVTAGAGKGCTDCHNSTVAHIDGNARTFDDTDSSTLNPSYYRQGYRLKQVSGQEPMLIPRPYNTGNPADHYRLCLQGGCHNSGSYINSADMSTNLRTDGVNRHEYHLVVNTQNIWPSDWSGSHNSRMSCPSCHNVHGSTRLAMVRDGKLTGREPGLMIWYNNDDIVTNNASNPSPPSPENLPLSASTGTIWRGNTSGNLCTHCHGSDNTLPEYRNPYQAVSLAPTLDWTGETNYQSDGVNPESATSGSTFTFRVKYTDANNDAPVYIEVWVDKNDNGTYEAGEKYAMSGADSGDTIYFNGKIYTKSLSVTSAGDNTLNYRFYASDGTNIATGAPTTGGTITISNNAPALSWTGQAYYVSDGVNPNTGGNGSSFEFRVNYTDLDNTAPSSIQVWVDLDDNGTYEPGEKYNMSGTDAGDTTYSDGKLYFKSMTISYTGDGILNYRFYASDGSADATGSPASNSTVTVLSSANNPPALDWVAAACVTNGVKPVSGPADGDFEFYVKYTDPDNQCPPAASDIQVWVDINDNAVYDAGEKYNLTETDPSDTTCSDGKLYKVTRQIGYAGDGIYNYRFYATDGTDPATGGPVSDSSVTVVNATKVKPSGGSGWYSSIQTALDNTPQYGTVLVYPGTYGSISLTNSGSGNQIDTGKTVRSVCGPELTIISGGSNVVYVSNITGVTIDGFGITGGTVGVSLNLATVSVTNSHIYGNTNSGGAGGGFYTTNAGSTLAVSNSVIYSNSATSGAGIFYNGGTGHSITNTVVRNNSATAGGGGGLFPQNTTLTITGSTIKDNTATSHGGGVYSNSTPVNYYRSKLTGNTSSTLGGAMYLSNSSASGTFENCIVAGNRGTGGGMVYANGGTVNIINSTVADNQATTGNGGALRTSTTTTMTVRNSILWNNTAAVDGHLAYFNGGTLNISDSIISTGGDGVYTDAPYIEGTLTLNISGYMSENDPLFVDAANGDYHIQSHSPAVDNASAAYAPDIDIDGDSRPQGSADDIGADEYAGSINSAPVLSWTGESTYLNDGVNPDSAVGGSSFEFRINYTDADNNAPASIQVWVDINDNSTYEASEKYDMTAVNTDAIYSDGKLYTKTLTLQYAGNGSINYRFYASDGTVNATGTPTSDSTLTVTNNAPVLSWTGEATYVSDGVNPDSGLSGGSFVFRVDYADADNTAPSFIEVWLDEDDSGIYDLDEKYGMTQTDAGDTNYVDGKRYSFTTAVSHAGDGVLNYRFYATDGTNDATGAPTSDNTITVAGVTVTFTASSQATAGESGTATITAQLSAVSGLDVTVPFTVNGSSTATGGGTDYSITASPIVITAGNTTADITITIAADSLDEDNETVIIDMGTPTNAVNGAVTTHTLTITDDDPEPTVTFTSASQATADESGTATITAQLSAVSSKNVTVPFTVSGSSTATGGGTDYSITASPITITAGNTTADITVTIAADSLDEDNETVIVNMGSPTNATQGATTTHTLTITDDDPLPAVTFTSASQATADESGTATITAQLSAVSGKNVTVPFTVNGSSTATGGGTDYSITASPITIIAGNASANITVTITQDSVVEGDETVIVNMGSPTNATQGTITTHTLTITDDDVASGTTYTVCKVGHADAPCNYQSINGGIDSASVLNGDTLLVSADTYSENINFDGKNITILAKVGAATTKIQGDGSANAVVSFLLGESSGAVIDGFTIDNQRATGADGRGVKITNSATPTIKNCIIVGNLLTTLSSGDSYWGGGIYINGGGVTIDNTVIGQNGAANTANRGSGIYAINGLDITILNSTISYNSGRDYAGIYLASMTGMTTLTNTNVVYNDATTGYITGGIYANASSISITGGSISNNTGKLGAGLRLENVPTITTINNVVINANNAGGNIAGGIYSINSPMAISNGTTINNNTSRDGAGIYLSGNYSGFPAGTKTTIANTTITGNSTGGGYPGGGIYSSGSPLEISNSNISSNTARAGSAIRLESVPIVTVISNTTINNNIADGTQTGGAIYSNSSPITFTGGTISGNTNGREGGGLYLTGNYSAFPAGTKTTITGTTINGNSSGAYVGGGIYTSCPITINGNAAITNNTGSAGGGIYITGQADATVIDSVTITGNTATSGNNGGGIYSTASPLAISNSTISSNTATRQGAAIFITGVYATTNTISNSTINGNNAQTNYSGGAIYTDRALQVDRTYIQGNRGGNGAAIYSNTTLTITNSVLTGNVADRGTNDGGALNVSASTTITNSTIAGNYATRYAGGLQGAATVVNSIFWGNTSGTSNPQINGGATVTYSDVQGGYAGTGNINADPLFVNFQQATSGNPTSAGDFHIQSGSPVVNQGTASGAPSNDIDGDSRPLGGGYDMGADEKE
ncbi:MAG: hypothetical protein C4581_09960, partial [Nitrospiraceae bacterium]